MIQSIPKVTSYSKNYSYSYYYKQRFNNVNIQGNANDNIKELSLDDQQFFEWMDRVEQKVIEKVGFYLLDLPDENYRVNFEHGLNDEEMAQIIINNFYYYN